MQRQTLVTRFFRLLAVDYVIASFFILALLVFVPIVLLSVPWLLAGIVLAWVMRAVGWYGVVRQKTLAVVLILEVVTAIKAHRCKEVHTTAVDVEGQIQGKAVDMLQNDEQHQVYFIPVVAPTGMEQQYPTLPQQFGQQQQVVVGSIHHDGPVPQWVASQQ